MNLYLGFEFEPVADWQSIMPAPQAPSNYKDPAKIQAYVNKEIERLRDGKAAVEPVCGRVSKAVVLTHTAGDVQRLKTFTTSDDDPAGSLVKILHKFSPTVPSLFGCKIYRALQLCAIELVSRAALSSDDLWMLGVPNPNHDHCYNRIPGYIDPVSVIFGSSDTPLHAVAARFKLEAPKDTAKSQAMFACELAGKLGY